MSPRNEDFLFAQEAQRQGFVSESQVEEGLRLQRRMLDELELDERLSVIMVKRGWLAEEQARRVYRRLDPEGEEGEIEGYEILQRIGRGAMGTVYKAFHKGLQRPVAIKVLRGDLAKENIHVERLKEEAKLLASLDHPNIVRALDAGESGGFPFVVMEYVEGESLKDRISRRGAFKEVDALKVTRAIADALERARRMGVVHRDVKPGNIILSRQGEPKLMDLGLAKGPVDLGLTQHGATVGTPQYISPEQAQDPRRADTRSDIYSLGATLYAMLTGRPPFSGRTLAEVLTKVLYEDPTPIRVLNKSVSPETAYLVERMMLKDPGLRYRTPAAVVHDIDEILAGRSIVPAGFRGNWEAFLLRRRIRRWTRFVAAALVAAVLLGAGLLWLQRVREEKSYRERGQVAIRAALEETGPSPSDGLLDLQQKLLRAQGTLEDFAEGELPGRAELVQRESEIHKELEWFQGLEREVGPAVADLVQRRSYSEAIEVLERYGQRIYTAGSPAKRRVRERIDEVRQASDAEFSRVQRDAAAAVAPGLAQALAQRRALRDALGAGFVVRPEVTQARADAERTLQALQGIEERVAQLESDFSVAAMEPRVAALRFLELRRDLDAQRRQCLAFAEAEWAPLDALGLDPTDRIRRYVEARLDPLDRTVDALVERRWRSVEDEVRELVSASHYEQALDLLARYRDAAGAAGYPRLRQEASEAWWGLEQKQREERELAAQELYDLFRTARERLREGKPADVRAYLEAELARLGPEWPHQEAGQALLTLADGLQDLFVAALRYLGEVRRVEDVRLRDGSVEKRWFVEAVDPAAYTLAVTTSSRTRAEVRPLTDVHPEQIARWATPPQGRLPTSQRIAALLIALPSDEPEDLRPHLRSFKDLVEAIQEAAWSGPLADSIRREAERWEDMQRQREATASEDMLAANLFIAKRDFHLAHYHLDRLLRRVPALQKTEAFEQRETEIRQDMATVEAELANLKLATDWPGARVAVEGDTTSITLDFDSLPQLEILRTPPARACGALESYVDERVVTPGGTNQRLHLLRGVDGLERDSPLVLPCIFDPAERLEISFDLFTMQSPFFLGVDLDGLQVAVLSADPTSDAYRVRWRFPPGVPLLEGEKKPPELDWYGRGRGVAFHAGRGFGDPTDPSAWDWPDAGQGRNFESWEGRRDLTERLFSFRPGTVYRVRVVRSGGRLELFVDDRLVVAQEHETWGRIGATSDRDRRVTGGTGSIQIWTWTPQAIDNLRLAGTVLERWR